MVVSYCVYAFPLPTEIHPLSLHDALPISAARRLDDGAGWHVHVRQVGARDAVGNFVDRERLRSEEHTSELQSLRHLVCRLLLEKKKICRIHASRSHRRAEQAAWLLHTHPT